MMLVALGMESGMQENPSSVISKGFFRWSDLTSSEHGNFGELSESWECVWYTQEERQRQERLKEEEDRRKEAERKKKEEQEARSERLRKEEEQRRQVSSVFMAFGRACVFDGSLLMLML